MRLVLVGVALLSLSISVLNHRGYWEDEIYTARDIGITSITDREPSFQLSFTHLTYENNNHPPLYFWVLHKWTGLFGFSELSSRGFSVLVFGLVLLVIARATKEWVPGCAHAPLLALLVFGSSSVLVSLATEARMYSLALLWTVLSVFFFVRVTPVVNQRESSLKVRDLAALAFINMLGLYTHYYFVFLYAAELLLSLALVIRRRVALKGFVAQWLPLLLFLPWIPQLLRQYEAKNDEGLWIRGPEELPLFLRTLFEDGTAALSQLLFGSDFQINKLLTILLLACALYLVLQKIRSNGKRVLPLLVALGTLSYLFLAANDLFHQTLTLTRTKYLFFLSVPLLMSYVLLALGSLLPIRVLLIFLFVAYNVTAIFRDRAFPSHPDWRVIATQADVLSQERPVVVAKIDYWLCLRFYLPASVEILNQDSLSVYPQDFWFLAMYLPWNENMQDRVGGLASRFAEVERVNVDRFSAFIRYKMEPL